MHISDLKVGDKIMWGCPGSSGSMHKIAQIMSIDVDVNSIVVFVETGSYTGTDRILKEHFYLCDLIG